MQSKICKNCNTDKALTEFYKKSSSPDNLSYVCKTCTNEICKAWRSANPESKQQKIERNRKWRANNLERSREINRNWARQNKEKIRARNLKNTYKISVDQYSYLLNEQNHCCAICRISAKELRISMAVDHCHDSGAIRGLLCDKCNRGLGYFKDNPESLLEAARYISKAQAILDMHKGEGALIDEEHDAETKAARMTAPKE